MEAINRVVRTEELPSIGLSQKATVVSDLQSQPNSIPKDRFVHVESLAEARDMWGVEIAGYVKNDGYWYAVVRTAKFYADTHILCPLHRKGKKIFIHMDKNDLGSIYPWTVELFSVPHSLD